MSVGWTLGGGLGLSVIWFSGQLLLYSNRSRRLAAAVTVQAYGRSSRSAWTKRRMRSARRWTPYLASRFETWNFAVRSDMFSLLAISLLERFSRSASRTSRSRRDRRAGPPGPRGRRTV